MLKTFTIFRCFHPKIYDFIKRVNKIRLPSVVVNHLSEHRVEFGVLTYLDGIFEECNRSQNIEDGFFMVCQQNPFFEEEICEKAG